MYIKKYIKKYIKIVCVIYLLVLIAIISYIWFVYNNYKSSVENAVILDEENGLVVEENVSYCSELAQSMADMDLELFYCDRVYQEILSVNGEPLPVVVFSFEKSIRGEWTRKACFEEMMQVREMFMDYLEEHPEHELNQSYYRIDFIYLYKRNFSRNFIYWMRNYTPLAYEWVEGTRCIMEISERADNPEYMKLIAEDSSALAQLALENAAVQMIYLAHMDDINVFEGWSRLQRMAVLYDGLSDDEKQQLEELLPDCEIIYQIGEDVDEDWIFY